MHDADEVDTEPIERDGLGRFPAGVSGNPAGRPRSKVVELASAHSAEAVRVLAKLQRSSNEQIALRAAEAILAYSTGGAQLAAKRYDDDGQGLPESITVVWEPPDAAMLEDLGLTEPDEPAALPESTETGEPITWLD